MNTNPLADLIHKRLFPVKKSPAVFNNSRLPNTMPLLLSQRINSVGRRRHASSSVFLYQYSWFIVFEDWRVQKIKKVFCMNLCKHTRWYWRSVNVRQAAENFSLFHHPSIWLMVYVFVQTYHPRKEPQHHQKHVEIKHTATACMHLAVYKENSFTYFQFFIVTLHLHTVTDTDFHSTASLCKFPIAGLTVNKRWTCSRIKTSNDCPTAHTDPRQWHAACDYLYSYTGDCSPKLKQNKTTKKTRSPASYAVIPVHCIQTRACAVCFAARQVMISSDRTLD